MSQKIICFIILNGTLFWHNKGKSYLVLYLPLGGVHTVHSSAVLVVDLQEYGVYRCTVYRTGYVSPARTLRAPPPTWGAPRPPSSSRRSAASVACWPRWPGPRRTSRPPSCWGGRGGCCRGCHTAACKSPCSDPTSLQPLSHCQVTMRTFRMKIMIISTLNKSLYYLF